MSSSKDKKFIINKKQALSVICNNGDNYHTFINPFVDVIMGCDSTKREIIKLLNNAKYIEIAGEHARGMKHGIAVTSKKGEVTFIKTDEEKLKALEIEISKHN